MRRTSQRKQKAKLHFTKSKQRQNEEKHFANSHESRDSLFLHPKLLFESWSSDRLAGQASNVAPRSPNAKPKPQPSHITLKSLDIVPNTIIIFALLFSHGFYFAVYCWPITLWMEIGPERTERERRRQGRYSSLFVSQTWPKSSCPTLDL